MLAISTNKSVVHMVDTETWESHDLVVPYSRSRQYKNSIAMSPDGRFVYSAGTSRDMWHRLETVSGLVCGGATIHDGTGGCTCKEVDEGFSDVVSDASPHEFREIRSTTPHCAIYNDYVCSMALSPDGKFLATTGGDHVNTRADILIWNTETSAIEHVIRDTGATYSLAISSDRSRIAASKIRTTTFSGPQVIVYNIKTGELTHRLSCDFMFEIYSVSFSPIDPTILAISSDRSIRQIDLDDINSTSLEFDGSICKYSPMGDVVASCGICVEGSFGMWSPATNTITIFSARTGELLRGKVDAHKREITDLCWSPCGSKIASSSWNNFQEYDGNCKVWDSLTFELIHAIDTSYEFGNILRLSWGPNWKRAVNRRLACAMALHERIGNGSFMRHLHPDMLRIMAWDAEHE